VTHWHCNNDDIAALVARYPRRINQEPLPLSPHVSANPSCQDESNRSLTLDRSGRVAVAPARHTTSAARDGLSCNTERLGADEDPNRDESRRYDLVRGPGTESMPAAARLALVRKVASSRSSQSARNWLPVVFDPSQALSAWRGVLPSHSDHDRTRTGRLEGAQRPAAQFGRPQGGDARAQPRDAARRGPAIWRH
jgi:hypothetical protein